MANHVVNSLKFEIAVSSQSSYEFLANTLPEVVRGTLVNLIDAALSSFNPGSDLVVIKKLELDLGSLRLNDLKNDLSEKFKLQFAAALTQHLRGSQGVSLPADQLPFLILDYFIRFGSKPTWLSNKELTLEQYIENAFRTNPKRFLTQVKGYLRNPTSNRRMLENFSEAVLEDSLMMNQQFKQFVSKDELVTMRSFFREQYRHLDAASVSLLFRQMLLDLIQNPNKIQNAFSFRGAVIKSLENRLGADIGYAYRKKLPETFRKDSLPQVLIATKSLKQFSRFTRGDSGADLIEKFQFFMENGFSQQDSRSSFYRFRNINTLFLTLLSTNFEEVVAYLLRNGKSILLKNRFLSSLSQEAITIFFIKVAPQKRKLLEWIGDIFEKVQEEYQPINQTLIQVKKSINEITFDLFVNKNLQSITDENYLRLLFKKTALKYGISYKNLLFLTLKSVASGGSKYRIFNFDQTLGSLYAKDILKTSGFKKTDLILFSTQKNEAVFSVDFKNNEEVSNLFFAAYQNQYKTLSQEVSNWLSTKLKRIPIQSTTQFLGLWEEFSSKYNLSIGEVLIPTLMEKKSNSSLTLSASSRTYWLNKYKIRGIYTNKKPNVALLLESLHSNKKMVSPGMLRKILLGLPAPLSFGKEDFIRAVELIYPRFSASLPKYLFWLTQQIIKNKAQTQQDQLYTWLYDQLLLLPKAQISRANLEKKAIEFLQRNERTDLVADRFFGKEDFTRAVELIYPRFSASLPKYLLWLTQQIIKNKAQTQQDQLYTWLYDQILLLPKAQISRLTLEKKAIEFLQRNERIDKPVIQEVAEKKSPLLVVDKKTKQARSASKSVALLFEILGLAEVLEIFKEANRYEEEILLKLLTTKYSDPFFKLMLSHQFNPELREAILIQSPNWLKKQVLDFLTSRKNYYWDEKVKDFTGYFEENKWLKLKGTSLENFIEKFFWKDLFERGSFVSEDFLIEVILRAGDAEVLTTKFWTDFEAYQMYGVQSKNRVKSKSLPLMSALLESNEFSFLLMQRQKNIVSVLPIFESLVYESLFPVAHSFEGSPVEEFIPYVNRLVLENKREFLNFFAQVSSGFFRVKFIRLLEPATLLVLIKEKQRRLGITIFLAKLKEIAKVFDILETSKLQIFYRSWLTYLFQPPKTLNSAGFLVSEFGDLLAKEGLFDGRKLEASKILAQLTGLFSFGEQEKKILLVKIQTWAIEQEITSPIFLLKTAEEVFSYFRKGDDFYVKEIKGNMFFQVWLGHLFELSSKTTVLEFLELFKRSFYLSSVNKTLKMERFFQSVFLSTEALDSYKKSIDSHPKDWIIFKQNAPKFFQELEAQSAPKVKEISPLDRVSYFLTFGVLPKEDESLKAFVQVMKGIRGGDLVKLRSIFYTGLKSTRQKKNLLKILKLVDEEWFISIIFPKLGQELAKMAKEIETRTGRDLFVTLGIQHPVDRIIFLADIWSKIGVSIRHAVEFLLPVFDRWMETQSPSVIVKIFDGKSSKSDLLTRIRHASSNVKLILAEELDSKELPPQALEQTEEEDLGEGITIFNAGMVLCWPFFGRFFAALGLVEFGKFKGKQAEERGVQLLQYLVTGKTEFEEWDLTLNKILCGVPLNTPIASNLNLSIEADELVKKLINGTVFNWEKMRGTRLETFRETFLLREGRLYERDNRWELIVERKAYDVLMDTLTWNISMINLSWMKKRLNVLWK